MKSFLLSNKSKNVIILIETALLIFFVSTRILNAKNLNKVSSVPMQIEKGALNDELEFPPLSLPVNYFEPDETSIGSGTYSVIRGEQAYRSYPSTNITLKTNLYSLTPSSLPPIKSDKEIRGNDPAMDIIGDAKQISVNKYGDLARRFVGSIGEAWDIYDVQYADVDMDGKKETILSINLLGANFIGQNNVIIKGDQIIFSTDQTTFSILIPVKDGNGFFLEWDDNFKRRDGYVTTRFVVENGTFRPVYEQKIRYIRVIPTPTN